jgi:hypothetical protein
MATKQIAIKDLFEILKVKEILIADELSDRSFYVADSWVVRLTCDEDKDSECERDVVCMCESGLGSILIEFDEWDDKHGYYSTPHKPNEVVVYRLFKETDIDL